MLKTEEKSCTENISIENVFKIWHKFFAKPILKKELRMQYYIKNIH